MGRINTSGFTVIETMLFIAISGVLVVTLIVGTGVALNAQRYRDSVQTFKSFLQEQYSEAANVKNDRTNDWRCTTATEIERDAINGENRGQSSCVIAGRYIDIQGGSMTTYAVVARQLGVPVNTSDVAAMQSQYMYTASPVDTTKGSLEWSTAIAWASAGSDTKPVAASDTRSIAILIIRSPQSGQIYTFTSNTVASSVNDNTIKAMIVAGDTIPGQAARTLCIDPSGIAVTDRMSVYIGEQANGFIFDRDTQ